MNYIDVEQFLKQPKEVQEILRSYHNEYHKYIYSNRNSIPLMTGMELKEFIKSKGYKYMGLNNFLNDKWTLKVFKSMNQFEPDYEVQFDEELECFWEVACMIAADCVIS